MILDTGGNRTNDRGRGRAGVMSKAVGGRSYRGCDGTAQAESDEDLGGEESGEIEPGAVGVE